MNIIFDSSSIILRWITLKSLGYVASCLPRSPSRPFRVQVCLQHDALPSTATLPCSQSQLSIGNRAQIFAWWVVSSPSAGEWRSAAVQPRGPGHLQSQTLAFAIKSRKAAHLSNPTKRAPPIQSIFRFSDRSAVCSPTREVAGGRGSRATRRSCLARSPPINLRRPRSPHHVSAQLLRLQLAKGEKARSDPASF